MKTLRRIFVVTMIMTTVLSMSVVVAPNVSAAAASAGDLIKINGLSSVYYLAGDGKRYVFPNENTYFSWYSDFSGVKTIVQSELESYPLGANVTMRPGTKLVKITTDPKTYAVEPNGNLVWVPSEGVANALFGANWAKRIVDVSDAFFTNYKINTAKQLTAAAYPVGSLVKWAGSTDIFYINADGTASKISNESAFAANRFSMNNVIDAPASVVKPTVGADITAAVSTITDTSSGAGGSAGAGTGLTVALSSATPASATVITNNATPTTGNGQAVVPFVTVNFTAASDGQVKIKGLKFKRAGISADADLDNLYLYDGATRLTDGVSISSNVATFNNAAGLFTVPAGQTKSITLKGDMSYAATSGKTIGFTVDAATSVTTDGAAVSGSFPVAGNLMSTAMAADLGSITITNPGAPSAVDTSINPGQLDQELTRFTIQANNQDIAVERLILTSVGSIQNTDLKNFGLYVAGSKIASVAALTANANSNTVVDFDLSATPLVITKGQSKVISLRGDIPTGSTRTFYFSIQNQNDLIIKDKSYNVYVEPYKGGTWAVVKNATGNYKIAAGSLSVNTSSDAPTGNVVVDGNNVVLGKWDFQASGEDIKIQNLNVMATVVGGSAGGIDNGKIYVDGVQVGTTKDLSQAADVPFTFGSTFIVKAGTTAKVQVLGDVKTTTSTSYVGGETVIVKFNNTSTGNAQGVLSLNSLTVPASATNGTGAVLNITAGGMSVVKTTIGNQTVVAGNNEVRLGSFIVAAGTAEGVNVSSITVTLTSENAASITNMYLKDTTGVQYGEIKVTPSTSNIFSVNFTAPASGGKTLELYANVKSGADNGLFAAHAQAEGSGAITGRSLSSTAATTYSIDETNMQTMTFGSGNLYVNNGSHPDADILLAGTADNKVAEFVFNASNVGYTIDQLKLKVANGFATSTNGLKLSYTDKAGATQTLTKPAVYPAAGTGVSAYATYTYTGLTLYVPKNSTAKLTVYLNTLSIANGATSGANSPVYLDYNEGFNALADSGGAAVTSPTGATVDLYGNTFIVRKSKPTFARVAVSGNPTATPLYRFKAVADAAGDIELKQFGFTFATSGTALQVRQVKLYDYSTGLAITDTAVNVDPTSGTVKLLYKAVDNNVISVGTTEKTFDVKGTVTGWASGASITVTFTQDTAAGQTAGANTVGANGGATSAGVADYTANTYNIWSDKSATNHSTTSADWTNGYLLKNMTESQSFTY